MLPPAGADEAGPTRGGRGGGRGAGCCQAGPAWRGLPVFGDPTAAHPSAVEPPAAGMGMGKAHVQSAEAASPAPGIPAFPTFDCTAVFCLARLVVGTVALEAPAPPTGRLVASTATPRGTAALLTCPCSARAMLARQEACSCYCCMFYVPSCCVTGGDARTGSAAVFDGRC